MLPPGPRKPVYPDNPVMALAWADCMMWAYRSPDLRRAFKRDTGHDLDRLKGSPIERAINDATGYGDSVMGAFIDWATRRVWGEDPTL